MAALWASAWLLMLLRPALGEGPQPLAGDKASPVVNLKLDARRKLLTWRYSREVTRHSCRVVTPLAPATSTAPRVTADLAYRCAFPNALLHRGATLTLRGSAQGGDFEEELVFPSAGKEGSRATGFSCLIYDVRFMNCSWMRGPAAPADVQYHLYSWFSRDEDETECAQYMVDSAGVHVGCHFQDLGEAKTTDNYFFLLNGTSNESAIQFLDFAPLVAFKIEKYNPPANVTVHYNASSHSHVIRWLNPHRRYDLASSTFRYELDIQRTSGSPKRDPVFLDGKDDNEYWPPSSDSRTENTVRLRVRYQRNEIWSEWSRTLRFGIPEEGHGSIPVTLVVLVVGAATLSTVVLMVLCKRCSLWRRLFPPIPRVKGEVTSDFVSNQVTWVESQPPPDPQEPEVVLAVEETP
ncbi:granulocyte-macrophage colony-stimulating factor receptor subunit alpha-like [Callospermophilus lateralis]